MIVRRLPYDRQGCVFSIRTHIETSATSNRVMMAAINTIAPPCTHSSTLVPPPEDPEDVAFGATVDLHQCKTCDVNRREVVSA